MLLHVHPGNQVALFEIAATLIPLLLFGGVVAERVAPGDGFSSKSLVVLGALIALVGGYAILAEAVAITVVVTGEPTLAAEIFTIIFLIGGMIGVVIALVHPWHKRLTEKNEKSKATTLRVLTAVALFSVAVAVLVGLLNSLHRAGEGEFSAAQSAAVTQKTTEEAAVRSRILVLLVAVGRVEQQALVALTRRESNPIFDGYESELHALRARLDTERKADRNLAREINDLENDRYGTEAATAG